MIQKLLDSDTYRSAATLPDVGAGIEQVREYWNVFSQSWMAVFGLLVLMFYTLVAIFAPWIAPFEPDTRLYKEDGTWATELSPSLDYPLGTTASGYDVFSQVVWGSRMAVMIGFAGGFTVAFIGTLVGIVSGYYGGNVDEAIMRTIDVLYGLPFIPFVIVLVVVLGPGLWTILAGVALLYWLSTARIIRSEVLSIKERPYVEAAKATGASNYRIMKIHILPNVLPISALYGAIGIGYAIVAEASLAFLGFGDPDTISWGVMLHRVLAYQGIDMLWWLVPPGLSITLVVFGAYLLGRGYDEIVNPQLREV